MHILEMSSFHVLQVGRCGLLYGPVLLKVKDQIWFNLIVTAGNGVVKVYTNGQLVSSMLLSNGTPFTDTPNYDLTMLGDVPSGKEAKVVFLNIRFWQVDFNSDATVQKMYALTARCMLKKYLFKSFRYLFVI